jgi:hypothetical protein
MIARAMCHVVVFTAQRTAMNDAGYKEDGVLACAQLVATSSPVEPAIYRRCRKLCSFPVRSPPSSPVPTLKLQRSATRDRLD